MNHLNHVPQAVVVLAGARDRFQLPLALQEAHQLRSLVTDMYWPADKHWFRQIAGRMIPESAVAARFCHELPSRQVSLSKFGLCLAASMKVAPRFNLNRLNDRALGRKARRLALQTGAALFSYNCYAAEAFKGEGQDIEHRLLFQLHADPRASRRILYEEIERMPSAKSSLLKEYEMSLAGETFEELCREPQLANGWLATSTYAARSLLESGVPLERVYVVPYGVDANTFIAPATPQKIRGPFRVAYVGSCSARKGLLYLLAALRRLKSSRRLQLTIYTRGLFDRELIKDYADLDVEIKTGYSGRRLAEALHTHELFVFPSLSEGFGHVILEAMSCGLPVVATPHTCAPDVLEHGKHGFIVPIRDAEAIAERIAWGIDNRGELAAMGEAAATHARQFTWERFRAGVRDAYRRMVAGLAKETF